MKIKVLLQKGKIGTLVMVSYIMLNVILTYILIKLFTGENILLVKNLQII